MLNGSHYMALAAEESRLSGKLEQNEQMRQAYLLEFEEQDVSSLFRTFIK